MCGIAGFLFSNPALSVEPEKILKNMGRSLNHRGPNDSGIWLDQGVGIGLVHTRLSILDVSSNGHQPMASHCGRYVISFNGEIYNHLSLRNELQAMHVRYQWSSGSDTETILECICQWGFENALKKLVGMFAIALWDKQAHELFLARDRMGEKPLYYGWQSGVFLFGSELKALQAHPSFNAEIDRGALALYLRHNYIPAPHCIYKDISKLPAASFIKIPLNHQCSTLNPQTYWSFNRIVEYGIECPIVDTDERVILMLDDQLSQSVQSEMLSDVPLGAFLSGGVDSSVIVALMAKFSKKPIKTFTIGFAEEEYNEANYAKAVASHLKTEHYELKVTDKMALELIPHLSEIYCEPFADSSQIPTFFLSRFAREQVTVSLSGDGGDELFGGYSTYKIALSLWKLFSNLPLPLRKIAKNQLVKFQFSRRTQKFLELLDSQSPEMLYMALISHWVDIGQIMEDVTESITVLNDPSQWPTTDHYLQWMMAVDTKMYLADDVLVKVDRAAMANSLETRVPMLDYRVVELACRIPLDQKMRAGSGKWALKEVLYQYVPRELIERPKRGFSIPLGAWLRGELRGWAETLLDESRLITDGYFNPVTVRQLWRIHLSGRMDCSSKLWGILMFQAWLFNQKSNPYE